MSTFYAVKEGLSGFRRAKLAAAGSILTITIALLLLGIFYVISVNASRAIGRLREKVEMEAFLEEPLSNDRRQALESQLSQIEGIAYAQFVSKEDAARIFKDEFGEDINKILDYNPLPASYKIFLKEEYRTREKADAIGKSVKEIKGVADVIYRRDMLEFLDSRTKVLATLGLAVGLLFAFSAIFLVSNMIRLTIYAKRKAIQTMKLVGATRWFVRAPFLVEGIVQGIVGGLIAAGVFYYALSSALVFVSAELAGFIQVQVQFYVALVVVGAMLGLLGSAISVQRYVGEMVAN